MSEKIRQAFQTGTVIFILFLITVISWILISISWKLFGIVLIILGLVIIIYFPGRGSKSFSTHPGVFYQPAEFTFTMFVISFVLIGFGIVLIFFI